MDYSIIIPAFNKADLTRNCLLALRPTLEEAGEGEVIVIDNASSDDTQHMLAEFPWIVSVRNEINTGFAAANNQGARLARGKYLVLLNNDTQPHKGWLKTMLQTAREPGVGAVGARLLFPDGTIQHAGVVIVPEHYGSQAFTPVHQWYRQAGNFPQALRRRDLQIVTGACLATPRKLYVESGGLDEIFWNGYEDVDYCLRLRERGLRVVYEPAAVLTHFESQSGPQRFRKVSWNIGVLGARWGGKVAFDSGLISLEAGTVARYLRRGRGVLEREGLVAPNTTVLVHGARGSDAAMTAALRSVHAPIGEVVFATAQDAVATARAMMERRGDRYLALVDARAALEPGWLDELAAQMQFSPGTAAATYAPEIATSADMAALTADARCTLLHLEKFPQHLRLEDLQTLDGSVADLLLRAIPLRVGTRGASKALGELPPCAADAAFEARHGMTLATALGGGREMIEDALARLPRRRPGLVSIVMLSWNAPQFTKMALESICAHTGGEYEVLIVDNGSGAETVDWLKTLTDVRVIYNQTNRGFAGGNNQALAAARGEYVVLLNNDVIVTAGWLERLLHAFDRIPGLGVSAPRSNKIAGDQIVVDANYSDLDRMHAYAARRAERYRDQGYVTDRAIGLCLCIDRRVIEEVGGIDERFGVGNFEDDDFCLRVRAAGYKIFVCDDAFIHHFGSQTFTANKIDWTATMRENWPKFASKWELPAQQVNGGYTPGLAIRRGFSRERHYVPLPLEHRYDLVFTAAVRSEADWEKTGAFARRFARAFGADARVLLAIAALGEPDAATIGARLERFAQREGVDLNAAADIEVSDEVDAEKWLASLASERRIDVNIVEERSPSALRRYVESVLA